jgi:hypothetical protein
MDELCIFLLILKSVEFWRNEFYCTVLDACYICVIFVCVYIYMRARIGADFVNGH